MLVGNGGKGSFNIGSTSAHCQSGSHPVSGGFQLSINDLFAGNGGPSEVVLASARRSDAWKVDAVRLAPGLGRLTAFGYCGSIGMRNQKIDVDLEFKTHSQNASAPKCPRHWALVGGGFFARLLVAKSIAVALPISSGPLSSQRWGITAFAEADPGGEAAPLRVIGYCTRLGRHH